MEEEWKTLVYQNISYKNYEISNYGKIKNRITNRILKNRTQNSTSGKNKTPYLYTDIGLGKRGKSKRIILNRAVAETFLNNPSSYKYVIIKDGDYNNIAVDNLYWSQYKKGDENHKNMAKKRNSNSESVSKRRKKLKEMSVEYKGGKCIICGYSRCIGALEFHHLDPNEKDFGISESGTTKSWDSIKKELDKCICVCANCHREIHNDYISLEDHISLEGYKKAS